MGREGGSRSGAARARIEIMATVNVMPLPQSYRTLPKWLRPGHPPICPDGDPTAADIALARALFAELDPESQEWYRGAGIFAGL